jgi:hypothetical protein
MSHFIKFICDFVSFFIFVLASLVTFLVELAAQVTYSLNEFARFLTTLFVEGCADLLFIVAVVYISLLAATSSVCLYVSKLFLSLATIAQHQSEKLLHTSWVD